MSDKEYKEYKEECEGLFTQMGIKDQEPDLDFLKLDYVTVEKAINQFKKDYDAYMNNTENFSEEEDSDEPTPSQMNEELRRGGW